MGGEILFLDDHQESIQRHLQVVQKHGLPYHVFERPRALEDFLDGRDPDDPIGAFLLDMQMRDIRDLGEVNLPRVETQGGLAVGLAVAANLLRAPCSPYREIPVALLTGFPLTRPALTRLAALRKRQDEIPVFQKNADLAPFEAFVEQVSQSPIIPIHNPQHNATADEIRRYNEGLDVFFKMTSDLNFNWRDQAAFLGIELQEYQTEDDVQAQARRMISADIADRVALLIDLKANLSTIFNLDLKLQRRWFLGRPEILHGERPLDLIRRRHIEDIAYIVSLVHRVTGT
jgi:hypothetical protein